MSVVADVECAVTRFLTQDGFPQTFLMTGPWGVGKTYLWNKVLGEQLAAGGLARRKYGYVSVFGVASTKDLRERLFESITKADDSSDEDFDSDVAGLVERMEDVEAVVANESGEKALFEKTKARLGKLPWKKGTSLLRKIPSLRNYGPFLDAATFSMVKDAIVCIDDLERRSSLIEVREILGQISYLREERQCKVLLIVNDDSLEGNDKADFLALKEKVFDAEIRFDPPSSYAVSRGIRGNKALADYIRPYAETLKLNNIRVIQRFVGYFEMVKEHLEELRDEVWQQCAQTLLLFSARIFQPQAKHLPPLEHIKATSDLVSLASHEDDENGSEHAKQSRAFLHEYGWTHLDELDYELLWLLENGYVRQEDLDRSIRNHMLQWLKADVEAQLREAWNVFHHSFTDNKNELVEALYTSHFEHPGSLSPLNLDSAVRVLRDLGESEKADELIDRYVDYHSDNRAVLDLDNYAFFDEMKDSALRRALEDASKHIPKDKDMLEVLTRISRDRGWGSSDEEFLAQTTIEDYEKFFRNLQGPDLPTCLRAALRFGSAINATGQQKKVSDNVRTALSHLAAESDVNRVRLATYGIVPNAQHAAEEATG